VPSLRERIEDVEPLLAYFLDRYSRKTGKNLRSIAPETLRRCLAYRWPGNVRELENLVERHVILATGEMLEIDAGSLEAEPAPGGGSRTLDDAIRAELIEVLRRSRGKIYGKGGAAEALGLKPSTLQAKLKRHGLERKEFLRE